MALRITQICDACTKERTIRHIQDTTHFQWIEFYDGRYHMCPECVKQAVDMSKEKPLGIVR